MAISVAGGILTGLAWTSWCSGLILLFSLVPFLFIENWLFENKESFQKNSVFIFLLPGFLIFNIIALWWVHVASIVAVISLIIESTFLMTFIFWLAHTVRLKAGNFFGILALIAFWLSSEYLNLTFDPFQPWMNLGNGFAKDIHFIQWYDTTGTAGGTLWILLSNTLVMLLIIRTYKTLKFNYLYYILLLIVIIVPITISFIKFNNNSEHSGGETEVLIIQPNIDPYSQKFVISFEEQLETILKMADEGITDNTKWIITPETTIDDPINESGFMNNKYIGRIHLFLKSHPAVSIIIGTTTYNIKPTTLINKSLTLKEIAGSDFKYNIYNSALNIDTGFQVEVYHKSKLVLGFEKQFNGLAGEVIDFLLPKLGGTQSGYSTQPERTVFGNNLTKQKVAPIICFESVFGEFVTKYVANGAEFLCIITNDGWWKNTNGYKQHLSYASLRAIETRRSVARAANTGISCFIDEKGIISLPSEWWKPAIVRGNIYSNKSITPYVKYGDFILRGANVLSIFIIIIVFAAIPLQKRLIITS